MQTCLDVLCVFPWHEVVTQTCAHLHFGSSPVRSGIQKAATPRLTRPNRRSAFTQEAAGATNLSFNLLQTQRQENTRISIM